MFILRGDRRTSCTRGRSGTLEGRPYDLPEMFRGDGLLQKRRVWVRGTVPKHDIRRIPGHIDDLHFWTTHERARRELSAIDPRHHHVGEQQIDRTRVLLAKREGVFR